MNLFVQTIKTALQRIARQPKSYLIPLLPLPIVVVAFFLFSNATNKYLDLNFTYYLLWLTFIVFLGALMLSLPWLLSCLRRLRQEFSPWLLLIPLLLAGVATYFVAEYVDPRHRIQSDESILLSTTRSMQNLGQAGGCDQGYFSESGLECITLVQNFKAKSVPFFFSLIQSPEFPQGLSSAVVFKTTLSLLLPTALLFFLALLIYTHNTWIAAISTAVLVSHPMVLFQFHSASVEPWYLLFASFAGFVFVAMQRSLAGEGPVRSAYFPLAPLLVIAALVAFAAQTRQESLASFGFILAPIWIHHVLSTRDKTLFFATLSLFILPVLWVIYSYRGFDFQAGDNQAHGIGNLIEHAGIAWDVMTRPAVDGMLQVPFIRLHLWLAAVGFFYTLYKVFRNEAVSTKLLWFLILAIPQTLVIFENISGDMTIEINQRYSLVFIPLIAVMAAQGVRLLVELVSVGRYQRLPDPAQVGLMVVLCVSIGWHTARYQSSFENNIMYSRNQLTAEEDKLRTWFQANTPDEPKLFIYARPWHFIAYGQSSINYTTWQRLSTQDKQGLVDRYEGRIYYVRGLDCWNSETWHHKAVEQRRPQLCERFERDHALLPILRQGVVGGYQLALSKLDFSSGPDAAKIQVEDLVIDTQADRLRVRGRLLGCGAAKVVFWRWAEQSQPVDCAPGGFEVQFASTPGLGQLSLLDANEAGLWERIILHPGDDLVRLTELSPIHAEVGWKELRINQSNGGNSLTLNGMSYANGLGAHAPSRIRYLLPQGYARLQFGYGLDDEEVGGDGVVYKVFGDGRLLWQSPTMLHYQTGIADVEIGAVETLDLVTEAGGDKDFDHSNWILPVLLPE